MERASVPGQIPVDIITGMKRSGKTSLINALLQGPYQGRRVSVFTNELGDAPYAEGCRLHAVLGGCICCTAQTELISEIQAAVREEVPEHLIVEMSGKGTIREILQIFAYLPECRLHQLIYVADVRKWRALTTVMGGGFARQIRSAPILLLNRWEEVSPEARDAAWNQIRQWNPEALALTGFSQVDPEKNQTLCQAALPRLADQTSGGEGGEDRPSDADWVLSAGEAMGASAFRGRKAAPPEWKNKIRYKRTEKSS